LAKAGVCIKIITRETFASHHTSSENVAKALMRFFYIYYSCGDKNKIEIRDFHIGLRSKRFDMLHYESIHAKIILIDGMQCYLDSCEWCINAIP